MNTLSELQDYVRTLSEEKFKAFFTWMGEMMQLNFIPQNIHTEFKESRFKSGHVCVHCSSLSVVKTSFYMRHKILDCIREYIGVGTVKGIVEVDETFQAVSYKGNHKKSSFAMPRPARRRGGEVKVREISSENVI